MRILYIDNYDSFANTIAAFFKMVGAEVGMYKSDTEMKVISDYKKDMILLGPGPNDPQKAGNYMEVIDKYQKELPMFGICLGHQALMEYFGVPVGRAKEAVHGASSAIEHDGLTIFEGIENPVNLGRYHSLGVKDVPDGFVASATCDDIVMAARRVDPSLPRIESVQFHPESILSLEEGVGRRLIENVVRLYGNKL
jgi:anthranilate synthase/aminodeoxychorismate synthase-like glutamine amidotransferase